MNRYEIAIGKKPLAPAIYIDCNRKMIVGGRRSGKTTALLTILKIFVEYGHCILLSVIPSQKRDIIRLLRMNNIKDYRLIQICSGFDEQFMRGIKYLFFDNIENNIDKLQFLPTDAIVYAISSTAWGIDYPYKNRIIKINGMEWALFEPDDFLKK